MNERRVILGFSGGIDSSAAVSLLRDQGYDITALTLDMTGDRSLLDKAQRRAGELSVPLRVRSVRDTFGREVVDYFTDVAKLLAELAEKTGVGSELILYMLKIVGAGYVIEFACDTAEDAKMTSLANKISIAGKILIFCLTIPVIAELIEVIAALAEYGG